MVYLDMFDWVVPTVIMIVVVPMSIVAMVNLAGIITVVGATIRKSKKCNDIKELE